MSRISTMKDTLAVTLAASMADANVRLPVALAAAGAATGVTGERELAAAVAFEGAAEDGAAVLPTAGAEGAGVTVAGAAPGYC
jgi:hypothetical protein